MTTNQKVNLKENRKEEKGGLFRKIVAAVLLIGIIGLIAGVGTFAMISDAPKVDDSVLKTLFHLKYMQTMERQL